MDNLIYSTNHQNFKARSQLGRITDSAYVALACSIGSANIYINVNCMPDHIYRDKGPSIFLCRMFHITYTTNHFYGGEVGGGGDGGGGSTAASLMWVIDSCSKCGGLGTQWGEACHAARSGHPPGNRNVISGLCYSGGRPSRQHPAWRRRASLSVNAPKG